MTRSKTGLQHHVYDGCTLRTPHTTEILAVTHEGRTHHFIATTKPPANRVYPNLQFHDCLFYSLIVPPGSSLRLNSAASCSPQSISGGISAVVLVLFTLHQKVVARLQTIRFERVNSRRLSLPGMIALSGHQRTKLQVALLVSKALAGTKQGDVTFCV